MKTFIFFGLLLLSGGLWFFGLFLLSFGLSMTLPAWLRGFYHAAVVGFPFAAAAVIYFWFKEGSVRSLLMPIIALTIFGVAWAAKNVVQSYSAQKTLDANDAAMVKQSFDDLVELSLPASFQWQKKRSLLNFYYLQPVTDSFAYFFERDTYAVPGGYKKVPTLLSITVYAPHSKIPAVKDLPSSTWYEHVDVRAEELNTVLIPFPYGKLEKIETAPRKETRNSLLVFTSEANDFRTVFSWEEGRFSEAQAIEMLRRILPTIRIKGDLLNRLTEIEAEFYKANPEKKVPKKSE